MGYVAAEYSYLYLAAVPTLNAGDKQLQAARRVGVEGPEWEFYKKCLFSLSFS